MQRSEEYGRNRRQREFKIVNREIGLTGPPDVARLHPIVHRDSRMGPHAPRVFWLAPRPADQERFDVRARRTAAEAAVLPLPNLLPNLLDFRSMTCFAVSRFPP